MLQRGSASRQAMSVLHIGGQDTKVIALGPGGKVIDSEMNDECAIGTGKFLEVMAHPLGFTVDELAEVALAAERGVAISGQGRSTQGRAHPPVGYMSN